MGYLAVRAWPTTSAAYSDRSKPQKIVEADGEAMGHKNPFYGLNPLDPLQGSCDGLIVGLFHLLLPVVRHAPVDTPRVRPAGPQGGVQAE